MWICGAYASKMFLRLLSIHPYRRVHDRLATPKTIEKCKWLYQALQYRYNHVRNSFKRREGIITASEHHVSP